MTYFECYADESLLKFLGFTSADLKGGHSFGRSRVSAKLNKVSDSLGVIDEDPNASRDSYLRYLMGLKPKYSDNHLICAIDPATKNKLIVFRPNLEAWSIKLAKEKQIDLNEYDLPNDWKKLHDTLRIEKNERKRQKFIQFISQIADHPSVIKLKELIK